MKERMRFIGNFVFILFLFVLLYSFAMFQGGFVSWFLFFSFLPMFLYHIGLLLYPLKNWKVTRKISRQIIRAGDSATIHVKIQRRFPFPLYYCVFEEILPDSLKKLDSRKDKYNFMDDPDKLFVNRQIKKIIFPSIRRVVEFSYTLEQVPRGEHHLHALRVRTGDVFGFVRKEHVFELPNRLIAYPNERPVRLKGKSANFEQGSTASYMLNLKNTNVATGIREYMPGDKFSWIDWKQTAKKNAVMTKEFEQEKSTDIVLILDGCAYEGMNYLAFEAAVEMTISFMEEIRKQSSQVGLVTIGEKAVRFPLMDGPGQLNMVKQHLTRFQPVRKQPFSVKLKEEMIRMDSGNIIVIFTNNLDSGLRDAIKKLKQRSKRIMIIFIQSANKIQQLNQEKTRQLKLDGVNIVTMSESELLMNPIEVRLT
ncbi:DUF58 domain-containing protein [Virgibacillus oceani]